MDEEKKPALKHKKLLMGLGAAAVLLVNMGYFPIWNFNPENPVEIDSYMMLMSFVMAFAVHGAVGNMLPYFLPRLGFFLSFCISAGLSLGGIGLRGLLEWGEVSNSYNFTLPNVLFQLLLLSSVSAFFTLYTKHKKK